MPQITIQPSQVAGIVNATNTRNANIPFDDPSYEDLEFLLNVTGGGVATGLLSLFLQDSVDGGATWSDLLAFPTFTFGAAVIAQRMYISARNDGRGNVRVIAGATPGAGVDIAETVAAGVQWELLGFTALLTCSAGVANRFPALTVDDGTANADAIIGEGATAQTASQVSKHSFIQGGINNINQAFFQGGLPIGLELLPGHRLKTLTGGIQAADQWSQVAYRVRERRSQAITQAIETLAAGTARMGPIGSLLRVREKVSAIAGGPTGPTYTITCTAR